jgi:hypothetical protein
MLPGPARMLLPSNSILAFNLKRKRWNKSIDNYSENGRAGIG